MKLNLNLLDLKQIGNDIWVIVLTGGPCGGKTESAIRLKPLLSDLGYKVLINPECATILQNGGVKIGENDLNVVEFQEEVLPCILTQEQRFLSSAMRLRDKGHKVVVLCDRGMMDNEAYVGRRLFSSIIKRFGFSRFEICSLRYHAVMHLVTPAKGAVKHYTNANNPARKETIETEAGLKMVRKLDQRTLDAWQDHHYLRVIDNSTDFDGKVSRLFAEICAVLGESVPA
ncbi:MAG: ATP-binding protein [Candidatus Paceibacterota bacterium]